VCGIHICQSAEEIWESVIARTSHFLAFISWIEERFFSYRKFLGANIIEGKFSSISASDQCFSSPVGKA
jgi:hypothetical protein